MACYLNGNVGIPPFAGRVLSSTDIVLHELWPLAGRRPWLLGCTTFLGVLLPYLVVGYMSAPSWRTAFLSLSFMAVLALLVWSDQWPVPRRLSISRLRTPRRRRSAVATIIVGGLFGTAVMSLWPNILGPIAGPVLGAVLGTALGLIGALGGFSVSATGPCDMLRDDFKGWLIGTFALALVGGAVGWATMPSPLAALIGACVVGLPGLVITGGLGALGGPASMRYFMLILCTRRQLPLRLSRFLYWCHCDVGLLRTAGIAYQFRHREVQDHLGPR